MARVLDGVLTSLRNDRQLAIRHPALFNTCVSAQILIEDELAVSGSSRGLLSGPPGAALVVRMARDIEGILSFTLAQGDELSSSWHNTLIERIKSGSEAGEDEWLQQLLSSPFVTWRRVRSDVPLRILRNILSRILNQSDASESEAALWLNLAMSYADKGELHLCALPADAVRS